MKINVKAYAKINLILDIIGKRNDGYHLLKMVMQSVDLFDSVSVSEDGDMGQIELQCTNDEVPKDESNIAWRAAKEFFAYTGVENPGIKIKIKKRIPLDSGLAGGSADGAAVILALDKLFRCDLSEEDLTEIGLKVGSDVPFCIEGGTMLVEGTGGIISPLPDIPDCFILLAKPQWGMSTKEAYLRFDEGEEYRHPDVQRMVDAVCSSDLEEIAKSADNILNRQADLRKLIKSRKSC